MVDERVAEIVRPCARGHGEARLDLPDVVVGHRAGLGVDDVVQAGQHRFGDAGRVVGALAAERLLQDLLDLAPVLGVEPLARDEDKAGEEAAEHVATDEEPDAAALAEMEDAERDLEQLLVCDLEQLVPRVRLEDLDQRLVVVAAGQQPGAIEHVLHLPAQQGDLPRACAVDGVGEEPEEAAFRFHLAGLVEPLHTDIVEIGRPVHGRARVRLGQVEQGLLARESAHLRRQLREAERVRLLALDAEDAEPRPVHRGKHVLAALGADLVLAVAEEREVVVVHPLQQRTRLFEVLLRDRGRRLLELGDRLVHLSAHRLPVLDRRGHVAEHALEIGAKTLERFQVGDAVDLDVDQRLRFAVLAVDLEQTSLLVPAEAHDRPRDQVHRAAVPGHLHRHRVDEERHVGDHGLDDRVRRFPAVLFEVRVVDVHLQLARTADAREPPVRHSGAVDIEVVASGEVVRRRVRVVRAHEALDVVGLVAFEPFAGARDRALEQCRLRLSRARGHRSLAFSMTPSGPVLAAQP